MRKIILILNEIIIFSTVIVFTASTDIFSQIKTAPNFALYNINGKRFVFYNILEMLPPKGIVILNFTSIYCKPCRKEIPELLSISGKSNRVKLICIYAESGDPVKDNSRELNVSGKSYVDPFGSIRLKFNVNSIPVTFIIDKSCTILGRFEGYTESNILSIKRLVVGK